MAAQSSIPRRLYKYRPFNNLTLEMLVVDKLFFADPSSFNDPLDSRPTLNIDCSVEDLEVAARKLISARFRAELTIAAKTIKYRGPKTMEHIEKLVRLQETQIINDIRYNATNPAYDEEGVDDPYSLLLGDLVQEELLRQYGKGIVSLAERATCPLMWSHYGDQHHGICIGYSVPIDVAIDVHRVCYGGDRSVSASDVLKMVQKDEDARKRVDAAVLFRKARDWRYEKERRLIGLRGLRDSLLELEEITFGIRCKDAVKYAVRSALEGRSRAVRFYEMHEVPGTFKLKRYAFENEQMDTWFPRRARGVHEAFQSVVDVPPLE